jgi:hypothetical protein
LKEGKNLFDEEQPSGEIWRSVPSIAGVLVSSDGRVMLMPAWRQLKDGSIRHSGGVPGWGTFDKGAGRYVTTVDGKTHKVARLVCEAFHGKPPFDGALVLHADENASNNRASNLYWGSQAENLSAPGFIEYCKSRTGENNPRVKAMRARDREWNQRLLQGNFLTDTGFAKAG